MAFEQAKQYLARTIPWPQDGDPAAFIGLHWTFVPPDHKPGAKLPWGGRAVRSMSEAVNALKWAVNGTATRDIYVCMSTQRHANAKVGKKNVQYFTPVRGQQNAVCLKSLFLDIDFKGPPHGYDTKEEAVRELARFLKETDLPRPSVLVMSGGGVHVYWTLDRALTLENWQPLAYALSEATKKHNLRCDTQVTVDGARVLRIPDTFNRKHAAPRPVQLAGDTGLDYSVDRIWRSLEAYKVATPAPLQTFTLDPNVFPPRPPSEEGGELAAGIEKSTFAPFVIEDIASECAFVREALATGGQQYNQSEWNLTTLLATFCADPRQQAHRLGDKHPGYTKESTDEMFDRKEREKTEKGLGWPSCTSISSAGSKACQSCKHFSAGRTPFHATISVRPANRPTPNAPAVVGLLSSQTPQVTSQVTPQVISQVISQVTQSQDPDLPKGYMRGSDGIISQSVSQEDGTVVFDPICNYSMEDPWLQGNPDVLNFTSKIEKGRRKSINIPLAIVGTVESRKYLQMQGFMVPVGVKGSEKVSQFMSSWIKQLRETRDSVNSAAFGWNYKGDKLEGFVFNGRIWMPGGSIEAAAPDPELGRQYSVVGDTQPWLAAARMITDQKRPALEAILASSFGAPLVAFTGEPGVIMSAYSKESGIGKTTTLRIAQAVWGDPVSAMQSLDDTKNYTMNKLGAIRNLPMYWDEIKSDVQTRKLVDITFETTQGKEKGRLSRNITIREPGRWQTLLVTASNDSLLDYVVRSTSTTTAGLYRVFEFIVPKVQPGTPGQLVPSEAALLVAKLNNSYGAIGGEYARFLGEHHDRIRQDMADFLKQLNTEVRSIPDERFWLVSVAAVLMGARYANHLGYTAFDEKALKGFMFNVLKDMRRQIHSQPVDMAEELNIANIITGYLTAVRQKHTLYTNKIHVGAGKPSKDSIKIDMSRCDPMKIDGVYVQVGVDNQLIRISDRWFSEWLKDKGYSRHIVTTALRDEYGAKMINGRMAAGVPKFVTGTEYIFEINLHQAPNLNVID